MIMASNNGVQPFAGNPLARLVKASVDQAWHVGLDTATQAWGRLENAFEQRVVQVLNALQIPTARDIHELNSRVASLQRAVIALERRAAQAAAPARAAARGKPAARTRKKSSARARAKAGT
jgi:hypothetical protein